MWLNINHIYVWMWHVEAWICGGCGSAGLTIGLDLKGIFQPKLFCDSINESSTISHLWYILMDFPYSLTSPAMADLGNILLLEGPEGLSNTFSRREI